MSTKETPEARSDANPNPSVASVHVVQVAPLLTLNGSMYQGDYAVLLDNDHLYGLPEELAKALAIEANPDPQLEESPATTNYDAVIAATAGQENEDTGGASEKPAASGEKSPTSDE